MKFIATLPSGATAYVDEIWKVAREFHQVSLPREQHENKPIENEPMEMWYNPVTRRVEPVDNAASED